MSSTANTESATTDVDAVTGDLKLEVVVLPVADADRSKAFYTGLGWRLDADFAFDNGFRVVQFTPPGSGTSVQFGSGITLAAPGSIQERPGRNSRRTEPIASRARIPGGRAMDRSRRSATPTGTGGSCKRSPSGYPVASTVAEPPSRRLPTSRRRCAVRRSHTASTRGVTEASTT
jgi:catechol 2,3-dioxygenase-like lactoylglutathione lyase family enzyme